MKRFALLLTILLTCMSLFATTADARRFGGGSSFGKQRAVPMQPQRAPDVAPKPASPPQQGNRWLGPLAGLAIGAGLGAMFGHGLGGGMGSILLLIVGAGVLIFLISRFIRPKPMTIQSANNASPFTRDDLPQQPLYGGAGGVGAMPASTGYIPPDFPVESFIRNAKTSFIRLQAANDRKDLDDIREYTTSEMFAEISMQMVERGDTVQKTDVLSLDAGLLEVATEGDMMIASVRFTGQLSENKGVPEYVDEIWHVQRDLRKDKSTWLLSGIQQTGLQ